jgi:hypothetical protein
MKHLIRNLNLCQDILHTDNNRNPCLERFTKSVEWGLENQDYIPGRGAGILLFTTISRMVLRSTQIPIQCFLWNLKLYTAEAWIFLCCIMELSRTSCPSSVLVAWSLFHFILQFHEKQWETHNICKCRYCHFVFHS